MYYFLSFYFYYFFFQAEDGIRDDLVTGVQTCALPICTRLHRSRQCRPVGPGFRRRAARLPPLGGMSTLAGGRRLSLASETLYILIGTQSARRGVAPGERRRRRSAEGAWAKPQRRCGGDGVPSA